MACKHCRYEGWIANPVTHQADPCPYCRGRRPFEWPQRMPTVLYENLIKTVKQYHPKLYLEIGVREGASLVAVLGADTDNRIRQITMIDPWTAEFGGTGRGSHDHIDYLLDRLKYDGARTYHDTYSKLALPEVKGKFDMVLVDGNHSAEMAKHDIFESWKYLSPGGIMVVDDVTHPEHAYIQDIVMEFIEMKRDEAVLLWLRTEYAGCAVIQKARQRKN